MDAMKKGGKVAGKEGDKKGLFGDFNFMDIFKKGGIKKLIATLGTTLMILRWNSRVFLIKFILVLGRIVMEFRWNLADFSKLLDDCTQLLDCSTSILGISGEIQNLCKSEVSLILVGV